ncbi:MAG: hypothetical protein DMG57_17880 [Acidobacteria bacterium]|nr:MAG: hypothetical protein DMG57_17880 [Acidobacteriota bacterium]
MPRHPLREALRENSFPRLKIACDQRRQEVPAHRIDAKLLAQRQGDIVRIRQQLGFTITNLREALQRFAGMGGNQISNGIKLKTKRPFNGARQGGGSGGACDE